MEEKLKQSIVDFVTSISQYCGIDKNDDNIKETPRRLYKMYTQELLLGYKEDPINLVKTFDGVNNEGSELIIDEIPVKSLCIHHFLPFYGKAKITVKYKKNAKVLGLSKYHRIVNHFCRKLQLQEQLTEEIAEFLFSNLELEGIKVEINARHLCVELRGVNSSNSTTTSISCKGCYKEGK